MMHQVSSAWVETCRLGMHFHELTRISSPLVEFSCTLLLSSQGYIICRGTLIRIFFIEDEIVWTLIVKKVIVIISLLM